MDEDTNELPADEEYSNVERAFWDHLRVVHDDEQDFRRSQWSVVFENLVPRIRRSTIADGPPGKPGRAEKAL